MELGIANRVVSDRDTSGDGDATRRELAAKSAGAMQAGKRLLKRTLRDQLGQAMRVENEVFSNQVRSADAKEAMSAFLEKRPPDFRNHKTGDGRVGFCERIDMEQGRGKYFGHPLTRCWRQENRNNDRRPRADWVSFGE